MKIYTKTGDKGSTSLLGGTRVPKFHPRIEAYGTIDELNAYVGLIRDQEAAGPYKEVLLEIQDRLFTLESQIAKDPEAELKSPLPEIHQEDVEYLEREIDKMNENLPELKNFILPGGHPTGKPGKRPHPPTKWADPPKRSHVAFSPSPPPRSR